MTPEEKRELFLKRILPALIILVIYFVFISNFISKNYEVAKQEYDIMRQKGISADALPGLMQRETRLRKDINQLNEEHQKFRGKLSGIAGYLTREEPDIVAMETLSDILAINQLFVIEQNSIDMSTNELPLSIREIKHWIQDSLEKETDAIKVEQLKLVGNYNNMYAALKDISEGNINALPVTLTMKEHLDRDDNPTGELYWELVLWM